jgi:plasmid stabilization system protein ParE
VIVRLTPEAEADIQSARDWYANQRGDLARAFTDEIESRIRVILQLPQAGSPVLRQVRRASVSRFPYCLYYVHDRDDIVFIACMHTSRDPEIWKLRTWG